LIHIQIEEELRDQSLLFLTLPLQGFSLAIMSIVKNFPFGALEEAFLSVGRRTLPITVVWGDQDKTVNYEQQHTTMEYMLPSAKFVVVRGAGHQDLFGASKFNTQVKEAIEVHFP